MYFFELVCIFLLIVFSGAQAAAEQCDKNCTKQCPTGMIPDFCTQHGSDNSNECVKDDRHGMEHGHWDIDYNKGYRCILRCNDGYIQNGCPVQRKWIEDMPTCVEDDWKRKAKDWGKIGLKVSAVVGAGTGLVVATPVILGFLGFGVAAGSAAATVQTTTITSGSILAWAQSVGATGYVGCEPE